jgi:serine O-acetyltransferase
MIRSHDDYLRYLEADRIALSRTTSLTTLLFDEIWKFQRVLRRLEYLTNCKKNRAERLWTAYRYHELGTRLGFSIPINVFGPGLSIAHRGTIVVNTGARVGANCRLHVCVNIGTQAGRGSDAPQIGDNCYIGPGAKLFGPIVIGPNTAIGANAVVNRSFPDGNATLGGIPAKKISDKGSEALLIKGHAEPDNATDS